MNSEMLSDEVYMPRIYIRDQHDVPIGVIDEGEYFNATLESWLAGTASILTFSIVKKEDDYDIFKAGRNLSFVYNEKEYWMNCQVVEQDSKYLTVQAWALGMEMNNETTGPYRGSSQTFAQYFNIINTERTIVIGRNDVADKKLTYEWTGTDTKLSRLFSILNLFEAEGEFVTELNQDMTLKQITLNIYKEHSDTEQGIGKDRRNETFFGGEHVTVSKKEDTTNLYTVVNATGKDGLTISSLTKEVKDADGNIEFCTYKTPTGQFAIPFLLYAPQAWVQFPSNIKQTDRWIRHELGETQYETAEGLYGYMLSELKKHCKPEVTWTIQGAVAGNIGDTISINDEEYTPTLYLDARITQQKEYLGKPKLTETTFSNVNVLTPKLSASLLDQMNNLINENKTYQLLVGTTNGWAFKNGVGETDLSVVVMDGKKNITSEVNIQWYADGVPLDPGVSCHVTAEALTKEVTVYRVEALDADANIRGFQEVSVTNTNDGHTPVVHPAWSWSPDGTDRFTTVYPNLNLLDGTKDFSGTWLNSDSWTTDGTYKGLTVKKRTEQWKGIYKTFTAPKDGVYTFSAYIKSSGNTANVNRFSAINSIPSREFIGNNFDWTRDSITLNLKANDTVWVRYEITGAGTDSILWVAGYKWEQGSTATIYTPPPSEDYANAYPLYEGTYTDYSETDSTNPTDYTWRRIKGEDGQSPYDVDIISANGLLFKNGVIQTTLTAVVYRGEENVTEQLDANQFRWTKINADGTLDKTWNTIHAGGTKSITVISEDIYRRATFNCDIVEI